MLTTPFTAQDMREEAAHPARRQTTTSRQAIISVALVIAAIVAVFVALSTVTPVAFAALGFLPLIQHRLMAQLSAD